MAGSSRPHGQPMQASHTCKGSVRYRYYCSAPAEDRPTSSKVERIAAGDLEPLVIEALVMMLGDQPDLLASLGCGASPRANAIIDSARSLATELPALSQVCQRQLIDDLDLRVEIEGEQPRASVSIVGIARRLGAEVKAASNERHTLSITTKVRRRSRELRIVVPAGAPSRPRNGRLVLLLGRAALAHDKLFAIGVGDQAADRELRRLARFAFLAPDIVAAILEGRQPASLAARQLARMPELPLDWAEQCSILGFA